MRRRLSRSIAALLLLGVAAQAQAKEYEGWVYNGHTGWARASLEDLDDSGWASNSNLGYRWGVVGIEAGHAWFSDFDDSVGGVDIDTSIGGWTLGLNFNSDINERWAFQARAGLFSWDVDGELDDGVTSVDFDDSGRDWYAGASVTWQWRKRSSIGAGYTHYRAGDADIDVFGFASEYRFGAK